MDISWMAMSHSSPFCVPEYDRSDTIPTTISCSCACIMHPWDKNQDPDLDLHQMEIHTPQQSLVWNGVGWLWSVFSVGQSFCSYPQHTSGNGSFAYSLRSSSTSGEPIAPRASPACKRKHCKSKWCLLRLHNLHVCDLWKLSQNL